MNYLDLTDENIYKLAGEQWEALPQKDRTSAKSIELCEDLFCIREMHRHAENIAHSKRNRTHRKKGLVMQAEGYISLLRPCNDGLWVSDSNKVYFLQGMAPKDFMFIEKDISSAIIDAVDEIDVKCLGIPEIMTGKFFMFLTNKGICLAGDQGFFKNLTIDRYPEITAKKGAAMFRRLQKTIFGQTKTINQFVVVGEN